VFTVGHSCRIHAKASTASSGVEDNHWLRPRTPSAENAQAKKGSRAKGYSGAKGQNVIGFSGAVEIKLWGDEFRRLDSLPERFHIFNRNGWFGAEAVKREVTGLWVIVPPDRFVASEQLLWDAGDHCWIPAARYWRYQGFGSEIRPATAYSLRIESDRAQDRHFFLRSGDTAKGL
jgi:hypothetical protein